jgi:hypothetical protein
MIWGSLAYLTKKKWSIENVIEMKKISWGSN